MTVGPGSRPRLAPRARLRLDRRTGKTVLLYPERGLVLSDVGQAVLELCDAERTVEEIVGALIRKTEVLWHLLECVQAAGATAPLAETA